MIYEREAFLDNTANGSFHGSQNRGGDGGCVDYHVRQTKWTDALTVIRDPLWTELNPDASSIRTLHCDERIMIVSFNERLFNSQARCPPLLGKSLMFHNKTNRSCRTFESHRYLHCLSQQLPSLKSNSCLEEEEEKKTAEVSYQGLFHDLAKLLQACILLRSFIESCYHSLAKSWAEKGFCVSRGANAKWPFWPWLKVLILVSTVLSTFGANTVDMSLLTVLAKVECFKVYHNSFPLSPTCTCFNYFLYQASLLTTYRHVVSFLLLLFRDILDCSLLYCLFQSCAVIAQQHRGIQCYSIWSSPICSHSHISYTYRTHLSK